MVYVFDVDGTICSVTFGDYENAIPFRQRIEVVNKLYEDGNHIYFLTARGMGRTNNNVQAAKEKWEALTRKQLSDWGVKFHDIYFGKPAGDIYVDDKGISDKVFFE